MRIQRGPRHKNPKLRLLTILKIERLEKKIAALIEADEMLFDAGIGRNRRGVSLIRENDRRTTEFKLRARQEAEKRAAAAAAIAYGSDGPGCPANWRNQPLGGSFLCVWKPSRCSTYFNPAYWGVSIDPDGSTRVTRIAEDASHPAGPDASSLADAAAMTLAPPASE